MKYNYDSRTKRLRDDKGRFASIYQVESQITKTKFGYRYRGKFIPKTLVEGGKKQKQTFARTIAIDRQRKTFPFGKQLGPKQQLVVRMTLNGKNHVVFGYYTSDRGITINHSTFEEMRRVMINHLFSTGKFTELEKRRIYEQFDKYVLDVKYYIRTWYAR